MRIKKEWVATQDGATGEKLIAHGDNRKEVVAELHQKALDDKANAYAHEQSMSALSLQNDPDGGYK